MARRMKRNQIFTRNIDGRCLAIQNWRNRERSDDALVAVPLSDEQIEAYRRWKKKGWSDEQIFSNMFPDPELDRVALPMVELTKTQLVNLTSQILGREMSSLERLSRDDLVQLLQAICEDRPVTRGYLV